MSFTSHSMFLPSCNKYDIKDNITYVISKFSIFAHGSNWVNKNLYGHEVPNMPKKFSLHNIANFHNKYSQTKLATIVMDYTPLIYIIQYKSITGLILISQNYGTSTSLDGQKI